ncbi:unnamed protein product [Brassicogethes aeneus]|uniref:DNA repair protein RAD50 n=1 Tax=Brassicogethes aeneus TaxID=1431903 RepID=A0A9P0AU26_BRAAE|nr:unnamed protein product [Brassicogethes aeneus]
MSVLNKLSICGVRSFSPNENEQIVFTTPVTLFLGQNGCGKTTIIESIKYACTGELPSGSKGGSGFLNNPNLTNQQSIKGNVKIKFFDRHGNEITIGRFMQVVLRDNKETFKTLVPQIKIEKPDGTKQDVSGRIRDVSDYCTQALNVSAPILNHVLFCHQEQSSWPLEEPKKLKERFDEIFDAAKYNKCVDSLRKLQRKKEADIKMIKNDLDHLQINKNRADDLNHKINDRTTKLSNIENNITSKKESLIPIENRIKEIYELEGTLSDLQRELTALEEQKKGLVEQQKNIKKHISFVCDGTDEDLKQQIQQFEANTENKNDLIIKLQQKITDIDEKTHQLREKVQIIQIKIGQFKEEQRQQLSRLQERKNLIQTATKHFKNQDCSDTDTLKHDVINEFKVALDASQVALEDLVMEIEAKEQELQVNINQLIENHSKTKQDIVSKNNIVVECQRRIDECKIKLASMDVKNNKMKKLSKDLEETQQALLNLTNSLDENKIKKEIEDSNEEIKKVGKHLEKLEQDYKVLMENHATEEMIENEKTSIIEKTSKINQLKNKHCEDFFNLFDDELPNNELSPKIEELLETNESKVKNLSKSISVIQKKVNTLEIEIKNKKREIQQTELKVSEKQDKIKKVCKEKPINELLQETERKKEHLQRQKGTLSSTKVMYESYIKQFEEESPCCPVCNTNFAQKNNVIKGIIESLKKQIECSPQNLADCEKKLQVQEEMFNKLQQLKPLNYEIELLTTKTLPDLKKDLSQFNNELKLLNIELTTKTAELQEPEKTVTHCRKVQRDVALIDQYRFDIKESESSILGLERNIVFVSTKKSRHETESEILEIKDQINNLKHTSETNNKKLDMHKKRCQELRIKKEKNMEDKIILQRDLQEGPHLEKQKAENEKNLNNAQVCIKQLNIKEKELKGELDAACNEKKETVRKNKQITKEANDKFNQSRKIIEDLEKLQGQIDNYLRNNNEEKLKMENDKLEKVQSKEQELNEKKNELLTLITKTKEDLAKQESTFRALRDNILLREKQVQEKGLESKINEQKTKIGVHNYTSLFEEKQQLLKKEKNISREINNIEGEKEAIEKEVKDYKKEQQKPINKNAYKDYKKKLFEHFIEQNQNRDLQKYTVALEKSILRFHKDRMVHINKVIRELWRAIYRGNDIDYIEIKTEDDIGSAQKRTYQYKVVQVKKGVEIDMRTRCSAGQRVLASLVIRMALAETFSSHCGILALDEPTTNLDRQNILSLSDALVSLIDSRKDEKNFQLLIITHDEEFLNTLTRVQSIPHFWKVSRNDEGFSIIKKVSI